MKKVLCFVLTIMVLLLSCKQNMENGGAEKPTPKDTSLKQLVIAQVGAEVISFASPIKKELTINLSKKVINGGAFTITATPKEDGVNVFFDNEKTSSKTKNYTMFQKKIKIEVRAKNSISTTYILTIEEPADDATLKELIIKQAGSTVQSFQATVADTLNVTLKKNINATDKLRIEAIPTDLNANVYFNSVLEESKTKEYTSSVSKVIIKVEKGSATKEYTLNITESATPSPADDATLKELIIKQTGSTVQSFQATIANTLNVTLKKNINATDKLRIEAIPTDPNANVYFNSVLEESKTKEYTSSVSKVIIKVEKGSATKEYTLNITESATPSPADDATLKELIIEQTGAIVKKFQATIANTLNVTLKKNINATDKLRIEAIPTDPNANVYFNSVLEESKTKEYTSSVSKVIIKVEKGSATKEYTLNITESTTPPPPPPDYNVKCNVVDSVGGSNIEGVRVKAYLAGTQTEKGDTTTDVNGNAYFKLDSDKAYDFVLSKNGRAASRVENAYIKQNEKRVLPIIMKEWFVGTKAIAPEIKKVTLLKKNGSQWKREQLKDNFEIDCATLPASINSFFYLETISKSEEIIPEKVPSWNNNNGIGMNIGSPFRHDGYGFSMTAASRIEVEDGKEIVYHAGYVQQAFGFAIGSVLALDGDITLYFIAYDVAGNRCERQERIKIKNGKLKNVVDANHHFEIFRATSKRYYRSLSTFGLGDAELFGMPSEEGTPTSLDVEFMFKFNQKIKIGRVDVMRREYQTGNIQNGWECVYVKQYSYGNGISGTSKGYFFLNDDSGTLEEGKTYQYKLVAYSKDGKITSNVATIRVMEAFNLLLTTPAPRAIIEKADIENQDFSFRISNPSLWDSQRSDYFSFGVLVLKDQYSEYEENGQPKYYGLCFATKLKYDFTKTGNEAFLVAGATKTEDDYNYEVFNTLAGTSSISLSDIFEYNNGTITLKKRFFSNASFNTFGGTTLKDSIYEGGIYYWDVPNMSKYLLKGYDKGVAFVKEYPYLDANTGAEVSGAGKSHSASYSNLNGVGGAVNGRSVFTIKY